MELTFIEANEEGKIYLNLTNDKYYLVLDGRIIDQLKNGNLYITSGDLEVALLQGNIKEISIAEFGEDLMGGEVISFLIDEHYNITNEAFDTKDLYNGTLTEALEERLAEFGYTHADKLADDFIEAYTTCLEEEINERDQEACDYAESVESDYLKAQGVI